MIAIALGALLGAQAALKGDAWSIGTMIVLNIAAAIYTLRLLRESDAETT